MMIMHVDDLMYIYEVVNQPQRDSIIDVTDFKIVNPFLIDVYIEELGPYILGLIQSSVVGFLIEAVITIGDFATVP